MNALFAKLYKNTRQVRMDDSRMTTYRSSAISSLSKAEIAIVASCAASKGLDIHEFIRSLGAEIGIMLGEAPKIKAAGGQKHV